MRSPIITLLLLVLIAVANAIPAVDTTQDKTDSDSTTPLLNTPATEDTTPHYLIKRRGGGGSSSGGSSGGRGSSGTGTGTGGRSRSNAGGSTTTGSGTPRSVGAFYGGGATTPFTSGLTSPSGLIPTFLTLGAISLLFSGAWLYSGVYGYSYENPVQYENATSSANVSLPVVCLCQEYAVCGCDENHEQAYVQAMVGNASEESAVSRLVVVDGAQTLLLNGTLDNGTTADGGTEEVSGGVAARGGVGLVMLVVVVGLGVVLLQ